LRGRTDKALKILAVDTSGPTAAVAVTDDGRLLGEYTVNHKKTHSQKLMPMMDELMRNLELKPNDIDVFAASIGPGSFTGLRIGTVAIKALAYALKKPVVGVPTLEALAYNACVEEALACPVINARNNQVYTSLYQREKGAMVNIVEHMGIHVAELAKLIKDKNRKVVFVGDAVEVHRKYFEEELRGICSFVPESLLLQKASSVAQAALFRVLNGGTESCFDLVPFYLRKSQAEREYGRKAGKA